MKSKRTGILCLLSGAMFLACSAVYENKASKWLFGLVGVLELLSSVQILFTRIAGKEIKAACSGEGCRREE